LKPEGHLVHLHDGSPKVTQWAHAAVVDLDVGRGNLQQCADAVMRLRAEYLWATGQADKIGFHLIQGTWTPWSGWAKGMRIKVVKGRSKWLAIGRPDRSRASFRQYLRRVFTYANSFSLEKELNPRAVQEVQPGDVLIQGGNPGHVILVIDVAENEKGTRIMLLAQSYMPAQEFHLLKNTTDGNLSPWYRVDLLETGLETPEWGPFTKHDLMTW